MLLFPPLADDLSSQD